MTDIRDPRRRLLPLLSANTVRHGTTSHTTCFYKCGNACDRPVPNRTDNPTFASVVQSAVSRRTVLKAAGVGALVVAFTVSARWGHHMGRVLSHPDNEQLMLRDALRKFIAAEIKPRLTELEHGDTPPYDVTTEGSDTDRNPSDD